MIGSIFSNLFDGNKGKEQSTQLLTTYIMPDSEDTMAKKELEVMRLRWSAFLKQWSVSIWDEDIWMNRTNKRVDVGTIQKKILQIFSKKDKLRKKLKALIRGGVPPELRGKVWWACLGGKVKMTLEPEQNQYPHLIAQQELLKGSQIEVDIDKDLYRTFPDVIDKTNVMFYEKLRRILLAYALRNKDVGYCQSMNYLCGLLIMHMEDEEKVFWSFVSIIEDILPSNYYSPSLLGGRIDQQVFQSCIAWRLPKVFEIFRSTNTLFEPITCPWFLCLYINVLPLYAVCRVWDCLFWEGSTVLFRIGLSLIKSKAPLIAKCQDFISIYAILKNSTPGKSFSFELERSPEESPVSNLEFLIQSAFGFRWMKSIPEDKVDMLRSKFRSLMLHEEEAEAHSPSKIAQDNSFETEKVTEVTSSDSLPRKPAKTGPAKKRKTEYILSIEDLQLLAMEADEGLGSHIEQFAMELHADQDSITTSGATSLSSGDDDQDFYAGPGEEDVDIDNSNDDA